jgi:hypothetical protein
MHYVTRRSQQMPKHKFGITFPSALFMEIALGPPEHGNSVLTFCISDAPKCTMWPTDPTGCKKTQVCRNVSWRTFCGIRTGPTETWKIVHRCITPRTYHNTLCDPQIPRDAKTQVRHNVSQHTFYGNHAGSTWAWKIVCRCFAPRSYQNAVRDLQILPDVKTEVRCNMSCHAFCGIFNGPSWAWKCAATLHVPDTPKCTTWPADPCGCKNTSSV